MNSPGEDASPTDIWSTDTASTNEVAPAQVATATAPAGWHYAAGDPEGTVRYWDGMQWVSGVHEASSPIVQGFEAQQVAAQQAAAAHPAAEAAEAAEVAPQQVVDAQEQMPAQQHEQQQPHHEVAPAVAEVASTAPSAAPSAIEQELAAALGQSIPVEAAPATQEASGLAAQMLAARAAANNDVAAASVKAQAETLSRLTGEPIPEDPEQSTDGPAAHPFAVGLPVREVAGAGARIGGAIVEGILASIVSGALLVALVIALVSESDIAALTAENVQPEDVNLASFSIAIVIVTVAHYLYRVLADSIFGGCVGKLIVGTRVADAASLEAPISIGKALVRNVSRPLFALPLMVGALASLAAPIQALSFLLGLLSLILIFAHRQRRSVMDFAAGTVVIRKPKY